MTKLHFGKGTNAYRIMDHEWVCIVHTQYLSLMAAVPLYSMVFWIGDLNYRLQTSPTATSEMIRDYAEKYQIHTLQKLDQVSMCCLSLHLLVWCHTWSFILHHMILTIASHDPVYCITWSLTVTQWEVKANSVCWLHWRPHWLQTILQIWTKHW